ncbi:MAG: hypothetical protein D3925_20055 [Candidatus Electrothrix sp. AR5]|nr:hypothetical protein [Candidatus Electrothrix sp. AR5]
MYKIGVVCEGPTDRIIIEAILDSCMDDYIPVSIQPPHTAVGGDAGIHGAGWKGIRTWCQQEAAGGKFNGILRNIDILIIQVDADVQYESDAEVNRPVPCPPPESGADTVRKLLLDWLALDLLPARAVFCVPAAASETWALAALFPDAPEIVSCDSTSADIFCIECRTDIKSLLRRLGKRFRPKLVISQGGRLKNQSEGYDTRSNDLQDSWDTVTELCSQAARFDAELRTALHQKA